MNEVNNQRSKLLADGMLHIEFLDGNSYLYSLQEIADIIFAQQQAVICLCEKENNYIPLERDGKCLECGFFRRNFITQTNSAAQPT